MTSIAIFAVIALLIVVGMIFTTVVRTVWIIPQARARNVERFGRYQRTLSAGIAFIVPFVRRAAPEHEPVPTRPERPRP